VHQQWSAVHFSTSLRVILAERKLYTDFCAKSQPSHEAAEGADFPKLDSDAVGMAGVIIIIIISGLHHYECIAPVTTSNLSRRLKSS